MTRLDSVFAGPTLTLNDAFSTACRMTGPFDVRAVHRDTGVERTVTVDRPTALVGRVAAGVAVRLDDPSVSRYHAFLQVVDGQVFCVDLGSRTGVMWDDGTEGAGWVAPGQTVRIGAYDVRVTTPGGDDEASGDLDPEGAASPAAVEVYCGAGAATDVHLLNRPLTLLGRHPNCHLRFIDDGVGYFHCGLVNTPDGVWLTDVLGRKGGTLVNGRPVRLARLRDGDLIELGRQSLVARLGRDTSRPVAFRPASPVANGHAGLVPHAADGLAPAGGPPLREMMAQVQECFLAMTRMIGAVQQEQAKLMQEQMRQVQELARELAQVRADRGGPAVNGAAHPAHPPAPITPPPQVPALPTPSLHKGDAARTLNDAHAWFLERLAVMSQATHQGT